MVSLPPGIPFLFNTLVLLCIPPSCICFCAYLLARYASLVLSTWLVAGASLGSIPFYIVSSIVLRDRRVRRDAARHGAILPPRWEGKSVGNIDLLLTLMEAFEEGYPGDLEWDKIKEIGSTYQLNLMWDPLYVTVDPNVIRSILATNFDSFAKGEQFRGQMHSLLGSGVFNSDGDMWKFHRSMTRPYFTQDRISHFDLFDRYTEDVMEIMNKRFSTGDAIDFQDLISRFTLDVATSFMFGTSLNCLQAPLPQDANHGHPSEYGSGGKSQDRHEFVLQNFAGAFAAAQHVVCARECYGWLWPVMEVFTNKTDPHMRIVDEFVDPILKAAIAKHNSDKLERQIVEGKGAHAETLLDDLVKKTTDLKILHDEVINILIAGRDTIATTLTFAVYFLCMYPYVLTRLRKEVMKTVGQNGRAAPADIKEMKYLRAFINETLRLYPPVPENIRCSEVETTLPNPDPDGKPFYVPPKTPVAYSVLMMQRTPELWGPDADEFDPDRFLDERIKYLISNPFIFLPFNAGPRICLGQQFAYNEMSVFLVRLIQTFGDMHLAPDAAPPDSLPPASWAGQPGRKGIERFWPKTHLTMYSKGGLWVRMTKIKTDTAEDAT